MFVKAKLITHVQCNLDRSQPSINKIKSHKATTPLWPLHTRVGPCPTDDIHIGLLHCQRHVSVHVSQAERVCRRTDRCRGGMRVWCVARRHARVVHRQCDCSQGVSSQSLAQQAWLGGCVGVAALQEVVLFLTLVTIRTTAASCRRIPGHTHACSHALLTSPR